MTCCHAQEPVTKQNDSLAISAFHGEVCPEPFHEQTLQLRLVRIPALGLPLRQVASGGIHVVDELDELLCGRRNPPGEHVVG
jgi:hypothetical protein